MKAIRLPSHPEFMQDFMALNEGQRLVYFAYLMGLNIMLTGGGGVGKSHFIRFLKKYHADIAITASTGIAGVNIEGKTIDSFMGFGKRTKTLQDAAVVREFHVRDRLKQVETILLDEGSMHRIDRFEMVDARLRAVKKDTRPFGGTQIILVADFMQLSPVLKEKTEDGKRFLAQYGDARFLFESPLYERGNFEPFLLHEYIRNGNPHERRILRNMRMGHNIEEVVHYINQHATGALVNEQSIVICKTNAKAHEKNMQALHALPGDAVEYRSRIEKEFPQDAFPAEEHIFLKEGCRVMLTVNNSDAEYMNGDLGSVVGLNTDSITVQLDRGKKVVVERNEWVHSERVAGPDGFQDEEQGTFFQLPVRLGYAITVHKSQGLTLPSAIADLSGGFNPDGLAYVLFSRVTSFAGLKLLRKLTVNDIKVNARAAAFTHAISYAAMAKTAERRLSMELHLKSFGVLCS